MYKEEVKCAKDIQYVKKIHYFFWQSFYVLRQRKIVSASLHGLGELTVATVNC